MTAVKIFGRRSVDRDAKEPSRVQDKRLQIELDAIRQSIFDGDGRRTAEVYPKGGDRVDWVATATQVAECRLPVPDLARSEGYSKPSAGGNATVPKGQEELESAQTETADVGKAR